MATKYRLSDLFEAKEIVLTDTEKNDTYTISSSCLPIANKQYEYERRLKVTDGIFGTIKHLILIPAKAFFFNMVMKKPLTLYYEDFEFIIKDYEVEITKRSKVIFDKSDKKYKFADEMSEAEIDTDTNVDE